MATSLDRETFDQIVDEVLEYNGTPRSQLYEYPYNTFQSNDIITKAEALVNSMMAISDPDWSPM